MRDGGRYVQIKNETQRSFNTQVDILKDVWTVKSDINFRIKDEAANMTEYPVYHRQGPGMPLAVTWGSSTSNTMRDANYYKYSVINVYTDFHKTFGGKHYVQALAGFNQEDMRNSGFWTKSEGLISEAYPTPGLSTGPKTNGEWVNTLALRGWFGRLNYIYDNRYIAEFNGRRDASSRFPRNSRWGFFPSASAAWNVSNEHFLESLTETLKVNMFKLRASYGSLGNQVYKENGNEVFYPTYPTMGSGTTASVLDGARPTVIFAPGTPAAGDLTWETVRTVNFGLDLVLLDNRFDLTIDKYTRYTEGMLAQGRELPGVFGASPPRMNAADLETKGWELSVGWRDKFELAGSPFNYSARFMIADARAKITKYDNPAGNLGDWYVGKEPGEIWGFVNAGFFNTEEDIANWHDQTSVSAGFNGSKPYLGDLKFMNLDGDKHVNADGKAQINGGVLEYQKE